MSEPCPYPDCKGERAHPSPHLIEAAAIDKRMAALRAALAEAIADVHAEYCSFEHHFRSCQKYRHLVGGKP